MNRLFPLAVLAASPLAEARFGSLRGRHNGAECCPCPKSDNSGQGAATVTVTVIQSGNAPARETVTVTAQAAPIYVTQKNDPINLGSQSQKPQTVTVMTLPSQGPAATNGPGQGIPGIPAQNYPSPGSGNPAQGNPAQGIPAQNNPAGGSPAQGNPAQGNPAPGNPAQGNPAGQTQPSVMTKTVQPSGSQPQGPLAYSQPPQQTITVITQVAAPPAGSPAPGTVGAAPVPAKPDQTKPAGPSQPVQSPSRPKDDSTAASKTKGGRPSQAPKTVTVTPLPNAQSTTPATLPPQMQSPGTNGDPSHTMTQTIGGGGGDNIEIIIINIFTGETSCRKKHSGKPCQARRPRPGTVSASPCPSGMNSTRIATVFNTIMATVGPDTPSRNSTSAATAAPQTTSRSAKGRKPRAPLTSRSL